ncbi:MAG: hypothetical protein K6U00_12480, partial [Armatimonadetes bacterium]|nr:hypothetical protein [Armatimonadota bacterium]
MENPFLALLISLVVIFAATAVGRRLLLFFRISVGSPIESSVFGVGLGLGVLGYTILVLGLLGLLYRRVLIAVVGLALLLAGRQIIETINDIRAGLRRGWCFPVSWGLWGWWAYVACMAKTRHAAFGCGQWHRG